MMRKLIGFLLVIMMVLPLSVPVTVYAQENLAQQEYRKRAVEKMISSGIMLGYDAGVSATYDNNFGKDDYITRAQMITVVCRILGLREYQSASVYNDVQETHWANGFINAGTDEGIIDGFPDGTYHPDESVKYEDVIKMLVSSLGDKEQALTNGGYPSGYLAVASNTEMDKNANGAVGKYATRETVATLVYNALGADVKEIEETVTHDFDDETTVKSVDIDYTLNFNMGEVSVEKIDEGLSGISETVGKVGSPIDISVDEGSLKEATIKFNYNKEALGSTDESDLAVAWYDEKNGKMVLLDTDVDENSGVASAKTNHFSEYILIDKSQWYEAWRKEQAEVRNDNTETLFNIVFAVDASGSMRSYTSDGVEQPGNDVEGLRKKAVISFIDNLYSNDSFSVISFNNETRDIVKQTKVGEISDKNDINTKINAIREEGTTNIAKAANRAISILNQTSQNDGTKIVILLSDGDHSYPEDSDFEKIIEDAQENDITIYTIGLGSNITTNILQSLAEKTGGKYYKSNADGIIDTYKQIKNESIGWDDTDSDNDGIPDAIEIAGMRNQFGVFIKTDPHKWDTDGDGLSDGEEMGKLVRDTDITSADKSNGVVAYMYYMMKSDPQKADSDNDGINDNDDTRPMTNDKLSPETKNDIQVSLNGNRISVNAYKKDNTVYVPMKDIFLSTGARYMIDKEKKAAVIVFRDIITYIAANNSRAEISGKTVSLSHLPKFNFNGIGRIDMPLQLIAEVLYAKVEYLPNENIVNISCNVWSENEIKSSIYNAFEKAGFGFANYIQTVDAFNEDSPFWDSYLKYDFATAFDDAEILSKSLITTFIGFLTDGKLNWVDEYFKLEEVPQYKKAILQILKNINNGKDQETFKETTEFLDFAVDGAKNLNDLVMDDIKTRWNKKYPNKQIGKDMRFRINREYKYVKELSDYLKKTGDIIKFAGLVFDGVERLSYDYSNSLSTLQILRDAVGTENNMVRAIDEIEAEYTQAYMEKIRAIIKDIAHNELLGKGPDIIFKAIPQYGLANFVADVISKIGGWDEYAKNIDSLDAFTALSYNLLGLYETKAKSYYGGSIHRINPNITDDEWDEFCDLFFVTQASMIEGFNILSDLEKGKNLVSSYKHTLSGEDLQRICITREKPALNENIFFVQ